MKKTFPSPTPPVLAEHPELAPLAILDTALEAAASALLAAHPVLSSPDCLEAPLDDADDPALVYTAHTLATLAGVLREVSQTYLRALESEEARYITRAFGPGRRGPCSA